MSKIEAGRVTLSIEVLDFYGVVEDIESMFRVRTNDKGLDFVVKFEPGVPRFIESDIGKLRQVMINILGNAVKFTEYGSIVVTVGLRRQSEDPGKKRIFITVADSGPGIAIDEMNKVFEMFGQTQSGHGGVNGTGLGMAISREYARIMNGDISVESKVGKGSVFCFEFEARSVDDKEVVKLDPDQDRKITGLKIKFEAPLVLIVDDSDTNRDVLRLMLKKTGIDTCEAYDGYSAVDIAKEKMPDAVLMDMRMPGMNGLETAKRIRQIEGLEDIPVIMVTASALEEQRLEAMRAGLDGFVRKPFKEYEILKELGSKLDLEYQYEQPEKMVELEAASKAGFEDVSKLSPELIDAIRDMTECGNITALNNAIETQVRIKSQPLAESLLEMVENYRYEAILNLLDQAQNNDKD
jgi:CheY-like chemotaxis protein